jgi:GxxExxY protein
MIYEELSKQILECCFEVSNELGVGFIESVYEKSLMVALRQKGISVQTQVPLKVTFRGFVVGDFFPDMIVEDKIIIELKAVDALTKVHYAQLLNYLRATRKQVGLVVNFGNPRLEYRRFDNRFTYEDDLTGMEGIEGIKEI